MILFTFIHDFICTTTTTEHKNKDISNTTVLHLCHWLTTDLIHDSQPWRQRDEGS